MENSNQTDETHITSRLDVLVVDDSALYRETVCRLLRDFSNVRIVGVAQDGRDAVEKAKQLRPHLMTLDVEMPVMNGLQTLDEIGRLKLPTRAIMLSSLTEAGGRVTMDALFKGAFDFIQKPTGSLLESRDQLRQSLADKLVAFDQFRTQKSAQQGATPGGPSPDRFQSDSTAIATPQAGCRAVIIGISTGGPQALRHVLPRFATDLPVPVIVVQHMPRGFTASLAQRLNEVSQIEVSEACDQQELRPGQVVFAAGDRQLQIVNRGPAGAVRLTSDPAENSCRPSVDFTLRSAIHTYGGEILAVIMTGMGKDGLEGCKMAKHRGATVFAQDQISSTVYGMPRAVIESGIADRILPLGRIAPAITRHLHRCLP